MLILVQHPIFILKMFYFREEPPVAAPKPPAFSVPMVVYFFGAGFVLGCLFFFALTRRKPEPKRVSSRR